MITNSKSIFTETVDGSVTLAQAANVLYARRDFLTILKQWVWVLCLLDAIACTGYVTLLVLKVIPALPSSLQLQLQATFVSEEARRHLLCTQPSGVCLESCRYANLNVSDLMVLDVVFASSTAVNMILAALVYFSIATCFLRAALFYRITRSSTLQERFIQTCISPLRVFDSAIGGAAASLIYANVLGLYGWEVQLALLAIQVATYSLLAGVEMLAVTGQIYGSHALLWFGALPLALTNATIFLLALQYEKGVPFCLSASDSVTMCDPTCFGGTAHVAFVALHVGHILLSVHVTLWKVYVCDRSVKPQGLACVSFARFVVYIPQSWIGAVASLGGGVLVQAAGQPTRLTRGELILPEFAHNLFLIASRSLFFAYFFLL